MRATVFLLMMLSAVSAAQSRPAHRHERSPQPSAERFYGLQDAPPFVLAPRMGGSGCRGGACTLTGGPSGEPSQS